MSKSFLSLFLSSPGYFLLLFHLFSAQLTFLFPCCCFFRQKGKVHWIMFFFWFSFFFFFSLVFLVLLDILISISRQGHIRDERGRKRSLEVATPHTNKLTQRKKLQSFTPHSCTLVKTDKYWRGPRKNRGRHIQHLLSRSK